MNSILSFREIYFNCNAMPLFEQVLREANEQNYVYRELDGKTPNEKFPFVGLFPPQILQNRNQKSEISPQLFASDVYKPYALDQNYKDHLFLPCNKKHQIPFRNIEDMKKENNIIRSIMINAGENDNYGIPKVLNPDELDKRKEDNFLK